MIALSSSVSLRTPTCHSAQKWLEIIGKNYREERVAQQCLSTGYKSNRFEGDPASIRRILSSQIAQIEVQHWKNQNVQTSFDLRACERGLEQISQLTLKLLSDSIDANQNLFQGEPVFQELLRGTQDQIAALLNAEDFQGRYLYGGQATDRSPINMGNYTAAATISLNPDTVDTTYYQGSQVQSSILIGEKTPALECIPLANHSCFEKLFRAMAILSQITDDPTQNPNSAKSQTLLCESYDTLVSRVLPNIRCSYDRLDETDEQLSKMALSVRDLLAEFTESDPLETMMTITQSQLLLEASISMGLREHNMQKTLLELLKV